jgi:hypothetical protein
MPLPEFSVGLSLDAVRKLLEGWKEHPVQVAKVYDGNPDVYSTWDFTPPSDLEEEPVRMTFANDELMVWGAPRDIGRNRPV